MTSFWNKLNVYYKTALLSLAIGVVLALILMFLFFMGLGEIVLGISLGILFGIIIYISNRYQAQSEMIEEDKLHKDLQDWKYRSMTRNSELTFRCRQSQLEEQMKAMGDSTLCSSNEPIYELTNND